MEFERFLLPPCLFASLPFVTLINFESIDFNTNKYKDNISFRSWRYSKWSKQNIKCFKASLNFPSLSRGEEP